MTQKHLCYYPHKTLLTPAKPVSKFGSSLIPLIESMSEVMYEAKGIGLAAPQIGVGLRLFIMDLEQDGRKPEVFINPELEVLDHDTDSEYEGCLSLPGTGCKVKRYRKVKLTAQNLEGEWFSVVATGLKSACFQHECDHLDGKLYITHLPDHKRKKVTKEFRRHLKQAD